jgi:hypothetical protein
MNPVYGNHLGIVINKKDPEERKRVQVFIPHLNNTLFDLWNKVDDKNIENISFKDVNSLGSTIIERLKQSLPWAEAAMPLLGGGTSLTSNTATGKSDVNNSKTDTTVSLPKNTVDFETPVTEMDFIVETPLPTQGGNQEVDLVDLWDHRSMSDPLHSNSQGEGVSSGYKPFYENQPLAATDENLTYIKTPNNPSDIPTQSNEQLNSSPPSNTSTNNTEKEGAKIDSTGDDANLNAAVTPGSNTSEGSPNGTFSVPNESAKVWVFFHDGDIQRPVYFAVAVDQNG